MIDLKPCPFCGEDAYFREIHVYIDRAWAVECKACKARTSMFMVDHPMHTSKGLDESTRYTEDEAQSKAAEAWNRRADDAEQSR